MDMDLKLEIEKSFIMINPDKIAFAID